MYLSRIKYLFIFNALLFSFHGFSQNFILNGSFEGPDGIEVIPSDWEAGCGTMNTPDTQPGWWNVENEPYEGDSYLDLLYKEDGTTESVFQKLETPLPKGSCFLIEIYLAQACQDSLSDLYPFGLNNPGDLVIRGSEVYGCSNGQILATFKKVDNCEWLVYYSVFQAEFDINYIYLEFNKGSSNSADGSILIDNFILDFTNPFPINTQFVDFGNSLFLETTLEGNTFNWTIDNIPFDDDSSFQNLSITDNILVEVNYLSADSCLIFESWQIYMNPIVPNVFTPLNQDNINDEFIIKGLVEKTELSILNRWGQVVYFTTDYQNNWSPRGIQPGTYFYSLYLTESDRYFSGFVSVF